MDAYSFNPPKRSIIIGGVPCKMGALSINKYNLIQKEYGGFEKLQSIFELSRKNINIPRFFIAATWLIYELIIDKTAFKNLTDFRSTCKSQKEYLNNINVLFLIIKDSQPEEKEEKTKSAVKLEKQNEDFFSRLYISVSREIKYTISEFYELTYRQVNQIMEDILFHKNLENEFQAALHGAKLDTKTNLKIEKISDKERIFFRSHAKKRMEQMRHGRQHANF